MNNKSGEAAAPQSRKNTQSYEMVKLLNVLIGHCCICVLWKVFVKYGRK